MLTFSLATLWQSYIQRWHWRLALRCGIDQHALRLLCGSDTFSQQAKVKCHCSIYTVSTEAKRCQFLFCLLSLPLGDELKASRKIKQRRGEGPNISQWPAPAVFGMIPKGTIICPQRASTTQNHAQSHGKDKLQRYSPTEGWRAKEAHWSATPEGSFHNSFWSCGKLITEAVSLWGHSYANIT